MELKKYSIWREGFSFRGNTVKAVKIGESAGLSFLAAVANLKKHEPTEINSIGSSCISGATLYDNEKDARRKFG